MTIEFSEEQSKAIEQVCEWQKDSDAPQIFRLFGYAGTGKTTIAKEIAANIPSSVMYGAFTGKAAQVMRNKGCDNASTIHSMIYNVKKGKKGKPRFELKTRWECDVTTAGLVILDECSMINEDLAKDLMHYGTKILVLGDPAQLPPVRGTGFFTEAKPDIMLTEVHRQARDNPIIRLSMKIREGGHFTLGDQGACKVISRQALDPQQVLAADQVLVGLNRTRVTYNKRIRELLRLPPEQPVSGDKLICLKNDKMMGLFNGSLWTVNSSVHLRSENSFILGMDSVDEYDQDVSAIVREEFFNGTEADLEFVQKKGTQEFTFGYAITCHKSQGSQWDNVMVFNEGGAFGQEARRWAYTAITRAAQELTVVI